MADPDGSESEKVKYLINIYEGNFVVKRDYIIQVSFGSTNVSKSGIMLKIFFSKFSSIL